MDGETGTVVLFSRGIYFESCYINRLLLIENMEIFIVL